MVEEKKKPKRQYQVWKGSNEEKLEPLTNITDDPRIRLLSRLYARKRKELKEKDKLKFNIQRSFGHLLVLLLCNEPLSFTERFIKAFAHDLQVSLLILDSSVLAPYLSEVFGEEDSENESDEEHGESGEELLLN
ncbi:hypothetical protein L1987_29590 [Smallanthus sonchifolius]|uniref:Uncharacterized protein n=1 Tax=Smallanthus sonchifolius TaxID=185202 RepID=A0ACB9I283_9ASTR|nr:hypothetical protein L1987_29590 [Smallanthus sonchifolius]